MQNRVRQDQGGLKMKSACGFSLIEVMVVMVIIGILAIGVVFMFANPSAKSKNQAFSLLGDLNMARSEAVSKNETVLADFLNDVSDECSENNMAQCSAAGAYDGYIICVDNDPLLDPNHGICNTGDTIIKVALFNKDVQFYDPTSLPANGPATTPTSGSTANNLIGGSGIMLDDGTAVTHFSMEPDGTLEDGIAQNINLVVYVPDGPNNHNKVYGAPYAVIVSSGTASMRISRWTDGAWSTK